MLCIVIESFMPVSDDACVMLRYIKPKGLVASKATCWGEQQLTLHSLLWVCFVGILMCVLVCVCVCCIVCYVLQWWECVDTCVYV
jgi:hypothetical protein